MQHFSHLCNWGFIQQSTYKGFKHNLAHSRTKSHSVPGEIPPTCVPKAPVPISDSGSEPSQPSTKELYFNKFHMTPPNKESLIL